MGRNISIAISAKDNFTQAITTMQNANRAFNKDLEGLSSKLTALSKNKTTLQVDADKAKRELKEARKAFKALNDEAADDSALRQAMGNYDNVRRNLKLVADEAKNTEKAMQSLTNTNSRAENRVSSMSSIENSLAGGGAIKQLMGVGIGKMVTDAFAGLADTAISSAFGGPAGNAIASAISGAATGAVMGSVAGPLGTAIGAGVGLAAGGLNAANQVFQAEDDAFKGAVQQQYDTQQSRIQSDVEAGSGIAAGRETSLVAFSTLFGDKGTAEDYLNEMKEMANTTPFLYDDLAQMSKVLKTYGYSPGEMIPQLTKIGDAGAALGMDTQGMGMVATGLGRMKSSGKTSLEYVNILQERGIDAIGYLGDALGVSNAEVYNRISKNLIDGANAAQIISDAMGRDFGGSMAEQAKTFSGISSTLEGMKQEEQNAYGLGFNETRKTGMVDQAEYLSQGLGEKSGYLIGQWEAQQQNQREWMIRNAEREAYARIEQEGLTGALAGKALAEARVKAEADYASSEGAKLEADTQKLLVDRAREILSEDGVYKRFGYEMGIEFSKGLGDALSGRLTEQFEGFAAAGSGKNDDYFKSLEQNAGIGEYDLAAEQARMDMERREQAFYNGAPGKAYGLRYVPKDGYQARLHEGERVLTAGEARAYRTGGAEVKITGNSFTVREEADIYKIAQQICEELRKAQQIS